MITEDEFQAALDANPDDHTTRLVFADWLDEQGDPRAEGYRALGILRLCPYGTPEEQPSPDFIWCINGANSAASKLPEEWLAALWKESDHRCLSYWPHSPNRVSRRGAEDAAALAFAKLPADRRAELLNPKPRAGAGDAMLTNTALAGWSSVDPR